MASQAQQILQELGLSEGYHIPIANDENLKLEAELQRLIAAKSKATAELDSLTGRLNGLKKHIKYVNFEQTENQNIMFARNAQLENEKHVYTLHRMEKEHMQQDIRNMTNRLTKLEDGKKYKCTNLKTMMAKMEKLKLSVQWDEQVMEVLEDSVTKKSDDNEVIKKYSKEDQKRAEELEMKRKRLREEELARRQLVVRTSNEIECLELTIGRNGQIYKQLCDERNTMVHSWQEAVKQLQQRNKDTIGVVAETNSVQDAIKANLAVLEEQRQFAENERTNNFELEQRISVDNTETARLRISLNKLLTFVQDREIETTGVQRELQRTATAVEAERAEKRRQASIVDEERSVYEKLLETNDTLKGQLTAVRQTQLSAEERLRRLEEMVAVEEATNKSLMYDVERMQGVLFRSQKAIADLENTFKAIEMTQRAEDQAIVILQRQTEHVETEVRQSEELMYKLTFRVNMLENRLGRTTGESINEDISEQNQNRLRELEKNMEEVNETTSLLQTQITRLEDDMRRLTTNSATDAIVLKNLQDRLHDRLLMVEGADKLIIQRRNSNNALKVQQNLLAVRVKGAENALKREGGVVYGLQRQRMELEAAVQERQAELTVERELLMIKRRALQDDSGRMKGDYQMRTIKIDQLKKRLDCILSSLGRSEDGETLSVTYFRVKNAQEKYALQQEGDRLDVLIRKAEHEIVAMENTLRVVNNTNDKYRKSLDFLEDDAEEIAQTKELEELLKVLGSEVRAQLNIIQERGKILRSVRASMEEVRSKCKEIAGILFEKERIFKEILDEEEERKLKLHRALTDANTKDCTCDDKYKDLGARQLKEVNKSAIEQLYELCIRFIETAPTINRYLNEHKIPILRSTGTLASRRSKAVSTRSSSSLSGKSDTSGSSIPAVFLTLNVP